MLCMAAQHGHDVLGAMKNNTIGTHMRFMQHGIVLLKDKEVYVCLNSSVTQKKFSKKPKKLIP